MIFPEDQGVFLKRLQHSNKCFFIQGAFIDDQYPTSIKPVSDQYITSIYIDTDGILVRYPSNREFGLVVYAWEKKNQKGSKGWEWRALKRTFPPGRPIAGAGERKMMRGRKRRRLLIPRFVSAAG
ncbi:MAG TPA: hypothetical protein VGE66_03430 [Chitinophagaceae bacterium]